MRFQIGQRIAIYLGIGRFEGVVEKLIEPDTLEVFCKAMDVSFTVHEKQCRAFKKKEKTVWWVRIDTDGTPLYINEKCEDPHQRGRTLIPVSPVKLKRKKL